MIVFLLTLLVASAFARPDVGLGYQYQIPATSYGVPLGSVRNLNNERRYYHVSGQGPQVTNVSPSVPSTGFEVPIHEHGSFTGSRFLSLSGIPSSSTPGYSNVRFGSSTPASVTPTSQSTFNLLRNDVQNRFPAPGGASINIGIQNPQQVELERHLYFYTAPDEVEEVRPRLTLPVAAPKKNVKILFIKVPSYRSSTPIEIPLQQQNQEKTVVYVLVKKPDDETEVIIPTPAPTLPSKPEVYFINYKTQKEAEEAVSNIQSGNTFGRNTVSANSIEGDQAFINSIGQDASSSGPFTLDQNSEFIEKGSIGPTDSGKIITSTDFAKIDQRTSSVISSVTGPNVTPNLEVKIGSRLPSGSSTIAPVLTSPVTIATKISGTSGIHETYGPPKI